MSCRVWRHWKCPQIVRCHLMGRIQSTTITAELYDWPYALCSNNPPPRWCHLKEQITRHVSRFEFERCMRFEFEWCVGNGKHNWIYDRLSSLSYKHAWRLHLKPFVVAGGILTFHSCDPLDSPVIDPASLTVPVRFQSTLKLHVIDPVTFFLQFDRGKGYILIRNNAIRRHRVGWLTSRYQSSTCSLAIISPKSSRLQNPGSGFENQGNDDIWPPCKGEWVHLIMFSLVTEYVFLLLLAIRRRGIREYMFLQSVQRTWLKKTGNRDLPKHWLSVITPG
jgi:hypothetical protein